MATKIKKGTEVWLFIDWNRGATVMARRCVVQSIGKQQATLTHCENGSYLKSFVYARDYGNMIATADLPDPMEEGLRRATEQKARHIEEIVNTVWHHALRSDIEQLAYFVQMRKSCERIMDEAPRCVFGGAR